MLFRSTVLSICCETEEGAGASGVVPGTIAFELAILIKLIGLKEEEEEIGICARKTILVRKSER